MCDILTAVQQQFENFLFHSLPMLFAITLLPAFHNASKNAQKLETTPFGLIRIHNMQQKFNPAQSITIVCGAYKQTKTEERDKKHTLTHTHPQILIQLSLNRR